MAAGFRGSMESLRGVTAERRIASPSRSARPFSLHHMKLSTLLHLSTFTLLVLAAPRAQARLGETEAQSQTRYGAPVDGMVGGDEKPLIAGAVERVYNFDGWRIRAAFVSGVTVRIQYVHIENSAPKKLSEPEMKTILEAEKGKFNWREERAKSAGIASDIEKAIKAGFSINKWERTDHATAELALGIAMQFSTRDADDIEKRLAKSAGKPGAKATPAPPVVPKF